MISRVKEIIKYGIVYGCITHCTFEYVGDFVVCNGPSMEPTLRSNNVLLTERISARLHKANRGDIIIARSPTNPEEHICKRIVGLPGDTIITTPTPYETNNDEVTIEKYVPRGFVWVEGDNKANSSDSRYYGPIPQGLIKSRVVCRLWPISEIKMLLRNKI